MARPPSSTHCISVGFYNDPLLFKLKDFTDAFDIVILNDGSYDVVKLVIEVIRGMKGLDSLRDVSKTSN